MDRNDRDSAERAREAIERGTHDRTSFRSALLDVSPMDRDEWLNRVLGLGELPDDDPELPAGCVPYLPCSVDALLRVASPTSLDASDVFVDVGSGLGRAAIFVHLLTGASVIGIEIQPQLVLASRELASRLHLQDVTFLEGDAATIAPHVASATVLFLYCPFSGERLSRLMTGLRPVAQARPLTICCLDLPLLPFPWLVAEPSLALDLTIYRSASHRSVSNRAAPLRPSVP